MPQIMAKVHPKFATPYVAIITYATLDLDSVLPPLGGEKAVFNVIIPPPGGHGKDVYTELGSTRVLISSI